MTTAYSTVEVLTHYSLDSIAKRTKAPHQQIAAIQMHGFEPHDCLI